MKFSKAKGLIVKHSFTKELRVMLETYLALLVILGAIGYVTIHLRSTL